MTLYLGGADRDKFDPTLDACVAVYREQLDEDGQVDFKSKAKAFTRTYGFLASVLPYKNRGWEKLSIFLTCFFRSPSDCEYIPHHTNRKVMDDSGVSQNIGTLLMIFLVVLFAGVAFSYVMNIEEGSAIGDYHPRYAKVDAAVVPALITGAQNA